MTVRKIVVLDDLGIVRETFILQLGKMPVEILEDRINEALTQARADGKAELLVAFVQGAKWWEYHSRGGATMWTSDQELAQQAALEMERDNTLGIATAIREQEEAQDG